MKAYIELEEVTLMEKATPYLRDRLLIHILFHLGCRISEALALKVEDIDFVHRIITIKHLKARLKLSCAECGQKLGRSHAFCPKCGGKVKEAQAGIENALGDFVTSPSPFFTAFSKVRLSL